MKLSIGYISARPSPRLEWFFDSLRLQIKPNDEIDIIIVDLLADDVARTENHKRLARTLSVRFVTPKPTIWQGKYRITSEDWWAASNARNTAFCLAKHQWIACLDDRCVLLPGWLNCIRAAMRDGYAVCGTYEKVSNLIVEGGKVKTFIEQKDEHGNPIAKDSRLTPERVKLNAPSLCPAEWFFGCSFALPMEWVWVVNGFSEIADSISMEDVLLGLSLKNNGYSICFDPRMKIIEDRSPGQLGTPMRREDKGVSPNDKSHAMLAMLRDSKKAMHDWDLKAISQNVKAGKSWPLPTKKEYFDWFDGERIDGNYMKKK